MKRLLALLTLLTLLLPCIPAMAEESAHEPITIMDANRDYSGLIELVHEKYPEINIEIIPYKGRNTTAYMKHTLETGHIPDIYSTSQPWSAELQQEHLIDLSQYAVTDMYNPVRLNEDLEGRRRASARLTRLLLQAHLLLGLHTADENVARQKVDLVALPLLLLRPVVANLLD